MRKPATILLLIISLSLLFAGAVSAQEAPSVDVTVIDENGDNVTVACPVDEVVVDVVASANSEYIGDPWVIIHTNPTTGLTMDVDPALMWDGTQWISNSDSISGGFLKWSDQAIGWVWLIEDVWGPMEPGDVTELFIPAIVTDTGEITTKTTFDDDYLISWASDSYTFLSVPCHPSHSCQGKTVPMQDTGLPMTLAALGLLGVLAGTIHSKLR